MSRITIAKCLMIFNVLSIEVICLTPANRSRIQAKPEFMLRLQASCRADVRYELISNDFEKMDLWERLVVLGRVTTKVMEPLEVLGYTEEEYISEGQGTFIGDEVKSSGVEVA